MPSDRSRSRSRPRSQDRDRRRSQADDRPRSRSEDRAREQERPPSRQGSPARAPSRRASAEAGGRGRIGLRVWVGGLPRDVKDQEVRDAFGKFGKIVDIRLKMQVREPPFAFVEFERRADAEDAIVEMNQNTVFGDPIKVQAEKGAPAPRKMNDRHASRRRDSRRRDSRRRRDRRRDSRPRGGYGRGGPAIPMGRYKITLEHLPHDMSWTELKELGRAQSESPAEVTFARTFQVRGVQCGLLEFKDERDAQRVVDKLDGRKIKGHEDRIKVSMGIKKF